MLEEHVVGLSGPWSITVRAYTTEFDLRDHVTAFTAVTKSSGKVALTLDVWLSALLRCGIERALALPLLDDYFDTPAWIAAGVGGGVVQMNGPGEIEFIGGRTTRCRFDDIEAGLSRRFKVEHLWLPSLEHALRPWRDGAVHLEEGLPSHGGRHRTSTNT